MSNKLQGLMDTTISKIKEMVDVNTILGDPVTTPDGTTILTVSRVAYGFAAGGSDFPAKSAPAGEFFGGGSGAGISVKPVAFLVVKDGDVKLLNASHIDNASDKALNMVPELFDKIVDLFKKDKKQSDATVEVTAKQGDDDVVAEVKIK